MQAVSLSEEQVADFIPQRNVLQHERMLEVVVSYDSGFSPTHAYTYKYRFSVQHTDCTKYDSEMYSLLSKDDTHTHKHTHTHYIGFGL